MKTFPAVTKTPSKSFSVIGPAILLALSAAGGAALGLPLPASVMGLGLVLLGLRVGVMFAAIDESPRAPARPLGPSADAREPALRAANG